MRCVAVHGREPFEADHGGYGTMSGGPSMELEDTFSRAESKALLSDPTSSCRAGFHDLLKHPTFKQDLLQCEKLPAIINRLNVFFEGVSYKMPATEIKYNVSAHPIHVDFKEISWPDLIEVFNALVKFKPKEGFDEKTSKICSCMLHRMSLRDGNYKYITERADDKFLQDMHQCIGAVGFHFFWNDAGNSQILEPDEVLIKYNNASSFVPVIPNSRSHGEGSHKEVGRIEHVKQEEPEELELAPVYGNYKTIGTKVCLTKGACIIFGVVADVFEVHAPVPNEDEEESDDSSTKHKDARDRGKSRPTVGHKSGRQSRSMSRSNGKSAQDVGNKRRRSKSEEGVGNRRRRSKSEEGVGNKRKKSNPEEGVGGTSQRKRGEAERKRGEAERKRGEAERKRGEAERNVGAPTQAGADVVDIQEVTIRAETCFSIHVLYNNEAPEGKQGTLPPGRVFLLKEDMKFKVALWSQCQGVPLPPAKSTWKFGDFFTVVWKDQQYEQNVKDELIKTIGADALDQDIIVRLYAFKTHVESEFTNHMLCGVDVVSSVSVRKKTLWVPATNLAKLSPSSKQFKEIASRAHMVHKLDTLVEFTMADGRKASAKVVRHSDPERENFVARVQVMKGVGQTIMSVPQYLLQTHACKEQCPLCDKKLHKWTFLTPLSGEQASQLNVSCVHKDGKGEVNFTSIDDVMSEFIKHPMDFKLKVQDTYAYQLRPRELLCGHRVCLVQLVKPGQQVKPEQQCGIASTSRFGWIKRYECIDDKDTYIVELDNSRQAHLGSDDTPNSVQGELGPCQSNIWTIKGDKWKVFVKVGSFESCFHQIETEKFHAMTLQIVRAEDRLAKISQDITHWQALERRASIVLTDKAEAIDLAAAEKFEDACKRFWSDDRFTEEKVPVDNGNKTWSDVWTEINAELMVEEKQKSLAREKICVYTDLKRKLTADLKNMKDKFDILQCPCRSNPWLCINKQHSKTQKLEVEPPKTTLYDLMGIRDFCQDLQDKQTNSHRAKRRALVKEAKEGRLQRTQRMRVRTLAQGPGQDQDQGQGKGRGKGKGDVQGQGQGQVHTPQRGACYAKIFAQRCTFCIVRKTACYFKCPKHTGCVHGEVSCGKYWCPMSPRRHACTQDEEPDFDAKLDKERHVKLFEKEAWPAEQVIEFKNQHYDATAKPSRRQKRTRSADEEVVSSQAAKRLRSADSRNEGSTVNAQALDAMQYGKGKDAMQYGKGKDAMQYADLQLDARGARAGGVNSRDQSHLNTPCPSTAPSIDDGSTPFGDFAYLLRPFIAWKQGELVVSKDGSWKKIVDERSPRFSHDRPAIIACQDTINHKIEIVEDTEIELPPFDLWLDRCSNNVYHQPQAALKDAYLKRYRSWWKWIKWIKPLREDFNFPHECHLQGQPFIQMIFEDSDDENDNGGGIGSGSGGSGSGGSGSGSGGSGSGGSGIVINHIIPLWDVPVNLIFGQAGLATLQASGNARKVDLDESEGDGVNRKLDAIKDCPLVVRYGSSCPVALVSVVLDHVVDARVTRLVLEGHSIAHVRELEAAFEKWKSDYEQKVSPTMQKNGISMTVRLTEPKLIVDKLGQVGEKCGYVTALDPTAWENAKSKLNGEEKASAEQSSHLVLSDMPLHVQMYSIGDQESDAVTLSCVLDTFVKQECSVMALPFKHAAGLDEDGLRNAAGMLLQTIMGWAVEEDTQMAVHVYADTSAAFYALEYAIQQASNEDMI